MKKWLKVFLLVLGSIFAIIILFFIVGIFVVLNAVQNTTKNAFETNEYGFAKLKDTQNLIIQTQSNLLANEAADALRMAAGQFNKETGKKIIVTSAGRTLETQATEFYNNCLKNKDGICKPITCEPTKNFNLVEKNKAGGYNLKANLSGVTDKDNIIQTLVANSKPENCPHTSSVAVDLWCEGTQGRVADPSCMETLTKIMTQNGFCRLDKEAWHFEWHPKKLSNNCYGYTDATYNVGDTLINPKMDEQTGKPCVLWDYSKNSCAKTEPEQNSQQIQGNLTTAPEIPQQKVTPIGEKKEESEYAVTVDSVNCRFTKIGRTYADGEIEYLFDVEATGTVTGPVDAHFGAYAGIKAAAANPPENYDISVQWSANPNSLYPQLKRRGQNDAETVQWKMISHDLMISDNDYEPWPSGDGIFVQAYVNEYWGEGYALGRVKEAKKPVSCAAP